MLQIANVSHSYGDTPVLKDVSLEVGAGEIVCLLGASGSGKSTLLRVIAGLEPLQAGTIAFDSSPLADPTHSPAAESRGFGFVFQDHVLFPHLSVGENIAFGLTTLASDVRDTRVKEELASVGLAGFENRFPHTLSGGQQQRVALARALATRPRLMLLDEPFASVDSTLRRALREDARRALREHNVPAIVVTHDALEAMELADRIAVVDGGRIVQCGAPDTVWSAPANRFVAELFGDTDAFVAKRDGDQWRSPFGVIPVGDAISTLTDTIVVIARPGSVGLAADPQSECRISDIRFLGDRTIVIIEHDGATLRAGQVGKCRFAVGDPVRVSFETDGVFIYNQE
ncbi:MAG: ABC transporter ATP-binding protein [Pseudomonadota bacterium]